MTRLAQHFKCILDVTAVSWFRRGLGDLSTTREPKSKLQLLTDMLEIACDEAGHTGPDLLQQDQRYFAFGSVALSDQEAFDIIQQARKAHPVQMPELKASKLLGSAAGIRLVSSIFEAVEGRYTVVMHDKLLALCAWLFEYIYEPVFKDDPHLVYSKDLHRYVAMFAWTWMTARTSEAETTIREFQNYMRSKDPADAPFLFNTPRQLSEEHGDPFDSILAFAYGYRDRIVQDNTGLKSDLPEGGKWTLDLSASALWSHLNHWGRTGAPLRVSAILASRFVPSSISSPGTKPTQASGARSTFTARPA